MAGNIKKQIKDAPRARREFGVILESIDSNVKQVAEAVDIHTQQLDRIEKRLEILEPMQNDLEAVKVTLQAVNLIDLKEQVVDLQKRVAVLEGKAR